MNWDTVLMLINIKGQSSQYTTMIIDRYRGFSLCEKSVNVIMKDLWKDRYWDYQSMKTLCDVTKIKQHIPYVINDIQMFKMRGEKLNAHNTTWIAGHNLDRILRRDNERVDLIFKDFEYPITVTTSSSFLEKQFSNVRELRRYQEAIAADIKKRFDKNEVGTCRDPRICGCDTDFFKKYRQAIRRDQTKKVFKELMEREPTEYELDEFLK